MENTLEEPEDSPRPTPGCGRETRIFSYCFIADWEYDLTSVDVEGDRCLKAMGLVMILEIMIKVYLAVVRHLLYPRAKDLQDRFNRLTKPLQKRLKTCQVTL